MIRTTVSLLLAAFALSVAAEDSMSILKPVKAMNAAGQPVFKQGAAQPQTQQVPQVFVDVEKLLQAKDYNGALAKLDSALAENPDDFRLIAIKAYTYFKYMGQKETGLKVIDDAIAKYPKMFDLYQFKVELLKHSGDKDLDSKILEVYKTAAENCKDNPLRLSNHGTELLKQKLGEIRIVPAMLLLRAAKAGMADRPDTEKFIISCNLAHGYYFCSRADLAAAEQAGAAKYAKNEIDLDNSNKLLAFYKESAAMAKKLDNVER
ncbi:MAG: tetratricopeptide repeat protein [Victivallaceae bacterium]